MSVANIRHTGEAVTFFTDTMVYKGDEPVGLCEPKARMGNAGRIAWTFRGQTAPGNIIGRVLAMCGSIEEAEETAAHLMQSIDAERLFDRGLELHLAGWCDQRGAARLVRMTRRPNSFEAVELPPGVYLNPVISDKVSVPLAAPDSVLVQIAMAQWKVQFSRDLHMCIGGSLWRTTVTPDGMSQEIAALYPSYDEDAARRGDPCADAVEAFRGAQRKAA